MMIALEARAPALNRLRAWTLIADQDLFGRWQAVVTFGRIGRRGQTRRHAFEDEVELSRFVRPALLRRRSAVRRIGVEYEAVEASPSALLLLSQLGLAMRVPPAPDPSERPQNRSPELREVFSIGGVEHAGAGRELREAELAAEVCLPGIGPTSVRVISQDWVRMAGSSLAASVTKVIGVSALRNRHAAFGRPASARMAKACCSAPPTAAPAPYMLHATISDVTHGVPLAESIGASVDLQREGKVRHIGVS